MMKTKLSFVSKYIVKDDGSAIFLSNRRWPKYMVKLENSSYFLTEIKSPKRIEKDLQKLSLKKLIKLVESLEMGNYSRDDAEYILEEGSDTDLNNLLRSVYRELNYFVKYSMMKMSYWEHLLSNKYILEAVAISNKKYTKDKLFNDLVNKKKMHLENFNETFGEIDLSGQDMDLINHNKWEIINDNNSKMDTGELIDLLEQTEGMLKRKGLGKLAYGKVLCVKTLGKVLADYRPSGDFIRISTKSLKNVRKGNYDLLHELGHRNVNMFMNSSTIGEINHKYRSSINDYPYADYYGFEIGDELLNTETGTKLRITKITNNKVSGELIDTPNKRKQKNIGRIYTTKVQFFSTGSYLLNGNKLREQEKESYFVSSYARVSAEEMYCELFAEWTTKGLTGSVKEWFKGLH